MLTSKIHLKTESYLDPQKCVALGLFWKSTVAPWFCPRHSAKFSWASSQVFGQPSGQMRSRVCCDEWYITRFFSMVGNWHLMVLLWWLAKSLWLTKKFHGQVLCRFQAGRLLARDPLCEECNQKDPLNLMTESYLQPQNRVKLMGLLRKTTVVPWFCPGHPVEVSWASSQVFGQPSGQMRLRVWQDEWYVSRTSFNGWDLALDGSLVMIDQIVLYQEVSCTSAVQPSSWALLNGERGRESREWNLVEEVCGNWIR